MDCRICNKPTEKMKPHKDCKYVYCGKKCAGIGRSKSKEEKQKVKAAYDKKYRAKNLDKIKKRKKEYFKADYDANPEKYKQKRKQQKGNHSKYINSPSYKEWKKQYDQKYLSRKEYGVFWECALLLKDLEQWLIDNRPEGIKFQMGITNKTQNRRKLWQRTQQQKSSLQRA